MQLIRRYKIPCIIALLQWLVTTIFRFDRLFFTYEFNSEWLICRYVAVKGLYFVTLLLAWCFGFHVYQKIKLKDPIYQRGLMFFCVYLSVMTIFLIFLWPGTWSWDDVFTLLRTCVYDIHYWQHLLTSVYQLVLMQILPFTGGFVFLQNVIISICISFCIIKIESIFGIRKFSCKPLDVIVKISPFLLPPVLAYQFSGYRMGIYVYFELTMLVILISILKDKSISGKKIKAVYLGLLCLLCILVSVWRTESIFYALFVCILIFFAKKDFLSLKRKLLCITSIVVGVAVISVVQGYMVGTSYNTVSFMRPCAELVRAADPEEDAAELDKIDKVVNLDTVYANPTANGEALFWSVGAVRDDYSKSDYNEFVSAVVKLSLKYPKVVIDERWNLFIDSSGITDSCGDTNLSYASTLYDENSDRSAAQIMQQREWFANKPFFTSIRKAFINILYMKDTSMPFIGILRRIVFNTLIPLFVLICAWFVLLFKKKWTMWLICSAVVIRIPIVLLTQPASWLMYWLSFYLLGYVFLLYGLLWIWSRKKEKVKSNG